MRPNFTYPYTPPSNPHRFNHTKELSGLAVRLRWSDRKVAQHAVAAQGPVDSGGATPIHVLVYHAPLRKHHRTWEWLAIYELTIV